MEIKYFTVDAIKTSTNNHLPEYNDVVKALNLNIVFGLTPNKTLKTIQTFTRVIISNTYLISLLI